MTNWKKYIEVTKNGAPRPLLVTALNYVIAKEAALDLGAGALNDSRYLLAIGFNNVIAIDSEKNDELVNSLESSKFVFYQTAIEEYDFQENTFNLVNAQFVLPFVKGDKIVKVMDDIKKSLKSGGLLVGQFFGPKDSWHSHPAVCVYNESRVKELLTGLEIIVFQEEKKDGLTVDGVKKHWDIFNFIVKKQ